MQLWCSVKCRVGLGCVAWTVGVVVQEWTAADCPCSWGWQRHSPGPACRARMHQIYISPLPLPTRIRIHRTRATHECSSGCSSGCSCKAQRTEGLSPCGINLAVIAALGRIMACLQCARLCPKRRPKTHVVNAFNASQPVSHNSLGCPRYDGAELNLSVAERNSSSCARMSSSSVMPLCSILVCFFSRFCYVSVLWLLFFQLLGGGARTCCCFL